MAATVRMLPQHDVDYMRETQRTLASSDSGVERRAATSWSTCRACGEKIAKGSEEIMAYYMFDNGGTFGGSVTSTEVHIHTVCPMIRNVQVLAASREDAHTKVCSHYPGSTVLRSRSAGVTRWSGMTPIEREYHVTISSAE